ncbi:MAG: NAD-dependent epimerase/dehydratase family protein [Pseudonocardiaceae bacterium]
MDIFVTGGSGFVGQHLVRTLAGAGHRVRALARSSASADIVASAGAQPARGDVTDRDALHQGMQGCDVAVHAAAYTEQWGPPKRFEQINVGGTDAVLTAARSAGVRRVIHLSTEAVLADGRPLIRVDETYPQPAHPIGDYARTKALAEQRVLAANGDGLATAVVRPRFVWGPGDTTILPALVDAARRGKFAWIDGGRYLTSTCHVSNACAGITLALERARAGEIYFLTDGEPVQLREFLIALAATEGATLPDRSLPRRVAWTLAVAAEATWKLLRLSSEPPITRTFLALSAQEMTVDDSKARRELGFRPVLSRDAGLAALASPDPAS